MLGAMTSMKPQKNCGLCLEFGLNNQLLTSYLRQLRFTFFANITRFSSGVGTGGRWASPLKFVWGVPLSSVASEHKLRIVGIHTGYFG